MLQDLEAHRQTEIDYFAGTVIKYGQKHGIATPVNYALYLTIKAKEKVYIMKKSAVKEFV
jgi:2-dehydropantoate 2-reductase